MKMMKEERNCWRGWWQRVLPGWAKRLKRCWVDSGFSPWFLASIPHSYTIHPSLLPHGMSPGCSPLPTNHLHDPESFFLSFFVLVIKSEPIFFANPFFFLILCGSTAALLSQNWWKIILQSYTRSTKCWEMAEAMERLHLRLQVERGRSSICTKMESDKMITVLVLLSLLDS